MNVFFIGKWIKRLLVLHVCFLSSIIIIIVIIRKKVFAGYSAVNIAPGSHWQGFRDYNQDKRFLKTFYIKI